MITTMSSTGEKRMIFLARTDMDILIYMTSDVWITPEIKRLKKEILKRAGTAVRTERNHNNQR